VTFEEMKQRVDGAVRVIEDVNLFPAVRVGGAYEYLVALIPERDTLPELLRGQFDAMWAAYAIPAPASAGPPESRAPFAHFTEEQVARCERVTREFAGNLARYVPEPARPGEEEAVPPAEVPPENGRAAAEE
jgi:hypothetical protein